MPWKGAARRLLRGTWWRQLRIVYVVVPHPDDEFAGGSLVQDRPTPYPVFVLCTHGERTVAADGHAHQPELGEWTPPPQPWSGPGSDTVRQQRDRASGSAGEA